MSQNNNIGELISQVSNLINTLQNNTDQMADANYAEWGKFISGLTQMQELSSGSKVGNKLNSAEIFRGVNESLTSLYSTTSGEVQSVIGKIQGTITNGFENMVKTTTSDIGKTFPQITDNLSTILSSQTKTMKRDVQRYYDALGDSLTFIPEGVKQGMPQKSTVKSGGTFLTDEIFARNNNNVSARRTAIRASLDKYKKMSLLSQDDYDRLTETLATTARGMSDEQYRSAEVDPFASLIKDLQSRLPSDKLGKTIARKVTQSQVSSYFDAEKDIIGRYGNLADIISGKYVAQRIQGMGGSAKGVPIKNISSNFSKAMQTLSQYGVGMHTEQTPDGLRFGFFDAAKSGDVLSNVNGRVTADWGKMAKYTVGLPDAKGMGFKHGGMQYADQFRTYSGQDAMGSTVGVTTVSQQLLETFFDSIATQAGKTNGFVNKIKNGDINLASQEIGRFLQDVIQGAYGANRTVDSKGASTNAVYSSNPNLAKDIQGDALAGSSVIQSVLRNSRIDLSEQLRSQYAQTFGINPKDVTGQDLQRMMDYVYAKVSSPQAADMLKNIPEYQQLLTKGGGFLDQTAQLIKQIAPHVGISSIKEGNYLFGQLAGIDTGVINPFNPITSASYRGIAQGANHVRSSKTRKGKTSPFREAVMRSDLLENFGLDYSSPEQMVMNMAEINDKTIADALQGYYQDLGSSKNNDSQLQSLYKKYISKQYGGKEIGSDFAMTGKIRSDMVRALSNRILPSVYNGGMVLSEDAAKHTEGYQSRRIELSDADIKKLGISQLPDGTSPLVDFKSNNVGKRNIRLSGGREISTKDLLQSVSYQDGQYYLSYDKFVGNNEFAKMLTGAGGRFTTSTNNILTTGEFNAIANAIGLDGMGIGGFVEATKDDPRKLAAQTGESWEGLFQQAKLAGKTAKDIQSVLRSNGLIGDDNSGFFRQDKHGNLYSNFTTKSAMESSGINLEDLYNTGMKTASGADSLFYTVAKGLIGDKADAFINNRVHASSVNKANEYTYFNPIGSTSEEYASANSHVKLTPREVEANIRSAGLLSLTSNAETSGAYRAMMNSYTGLSASAVETANNIKSALNQAYRMSTDEGYFNNHQEAANNAISLNGNTALFNRKTYLPGGTLSESDYRDNTFLGNLNAQDSYRMGYYKFDQEVDLGNGRKTSGVYIPNLGGTQMANGTFMTYGKIESALQAFGKPINVEAGSTEWNSIMAQRIGDYYAALQNEMGAADGTVKSILNGKKLTNAGALKAVTGQLPSNIGENTVVINDKYLKDMLRTGEGGDQAKNIANLEKLYSTMYGESGKRGNVENIIKRLKSDAKDSGDYENALINRIAQLTSVEGGSVGMQSLFHRYPFTQGLDNKNVRVRSSKNVSYGQTMVSRGLAEQINMDYDGDVGYLKNPYLSVDPDNFDAAYAEGGKLGEYNEFITQQLARMQGEGKGPNKHDAVGKSGKPVFQESLESLLGGRGSLTDYVTGVLSKGNFQHVGSLSNFSEYIRDGLTSGGLDESGTNIATAAQSAIVRSLFEQLEQDAISSKKVSQRLSSLTGGDASKVTPEMLEEAVHGQLSSVSGLMSDMNTWATGTARGNETASTGKFISAIKEGGFIDGTSANRTSIQTIAGVEKMLQDYAVANNLGTDWYQDQMQKLGLWESRLTDFDGKNVTDAKITDKTGIIDFAAYEKNLANAITLNPDLYKEGISAAYARKGFYAKDSQKALDQVVRDAGGKVVSGAEAQQGQAIGSSSALTNTYLERLVEVIEALVGASGNAATSVQQVNNSFAKTAIEAAKAQREMLAGTKGVQSGNTSFFPIQAKQNAGYDKNHLYDLFGQEGDGAVHQDYSFTQLASMLTGRAYTPSAKGLAVKDAIQKRQDALTDAQATNVGQAGLDRILGDILDYSAFGYEDQSQMLRDAKGLVSTQFGTLQHATMEHANKTFSSLSDIRSLFTDDSDIAKRIDDIKGNGLNYSKMMGLDDLATMLENTGLGGGVASAAQQIRSSMQALSSLGQGYKNTLGWLGVGQEGINADFANLDSVSSSIFKYLHGGNRQVISNEQALGMNVQTADGRMINLAGAFDTSTYDSALGELSLIDYKNTGRTTAENIMQQLLLKTAGELHQGQIRDAVKTWRNGFAQETNVVDKDGNLLIDEKGKITDAGYRNMATSDDDAFGVAKGDAKALQAWNEGRISVAFAHADAEGNVRIKDIIANSGMAMDALKTWAETGESLKPEQVKALTNLVSAIAREGGMFAAKDGTPGRFSWMPADEDDKSQEKAQQRAMQSSLGGYKNYNTAELNMLRAQKAFEKAVASGNAEAIYGAEQQLEGARQAAAIAGQYRGQFALYDQNGKQLNITNDKGQYLSDAEIRKQAGGEYTGAFSYYNQETGQMDTKAFNSYKEAHDYLDKMTILQGKHMQAVGKTNAQVKTMGSLIGEVFGGMKQTVQYLMRTSIVYAAIGKFKQVFSNLVQTIKSLNKSYVDLRIASGQTDGQMKNSMKIYNQMAKEMGKTTQEVANAANDWLRAGYNAEQSAKLIKNSMQLSTVGMIDSAKATEYLISTMKGWKLGVDDMEGVIDKMAELDRNAAISAGDIAEAMSRANVSAQLAGSELDKYMSYITTVSDVSQLSAETVGTAFKTLYSRYGNVKAGKFVAGAGDEENSEEFEALNDIEKVLNKIGIQMRTTSAEFRNFDDVLADIAIKWATLSDVEKNAISTAFAGTRQREVFNVLMENYDEVGKYERIAATSEGSTQEKMNIYGDSLEAAQNRRTAAIEEFTQNFNILGMDGTEILTKWNDLLAYIMKHLKGITTSLLAIIVLGKGLLTGSMFGGLAKLMQSLVVSASSFKSTMATIGTNLYNSPLMGLPFRALGKVTTPVGNAISSGVSKVANSQLGQGAANKLNGLAVSVGQTKVGQEFNKWRSDTAAQIQSTNAMRLYRSAYKVGTAGNMNAIQADRSAQLLSQLAKDPKALKTINAMTPERQQEFFNSLAKEQEFNELAPVETKLSTIIGHLQTIAQNTAADNIDPDEARYNDIQKQYGTDGRGIKWRNSGDKTPEEVAADKDFVKKYKKAKNAEIDASKKAAAADLIEEGNSKGAANGDNAETTSSFKAATADETEAYASAKAAASGLGLNGSDIKGAGTIIKDPGVKGSMNKASMSGIGQGLAGIGSMGAMMGGMIGGSAAASNSGREWTQYTGMGAGMLLSSGMAMGWNPAGWAMMATGAILGIATVIGGMQKTSKKIQEEAEQARSALNEGSDELKSLASEIENLKKQSSDFNKLAAGVDPETGMNVTLSDDEFNQYQDQLKEIIDARDELYASYNEEGDLIAMKNGEIVKSNELMKEAIELAQEEKRLKALNLVNDKEETENLVKSAKGYADKITNKNKELKNEIGDTGVSYTKLMNNAENWQAPRYTNEYAYTGWNINFDTDAKQKIYSSGVDATTFGMEYQNGTYSTLPRDEYDGSAPLSVSFQDGYLVDGFGDVIVDANGEPITESNVGDYLNLSDDNKITREGYEHVDELLAIQNRYKESGDLGQLILDLKNANISNAEKAAFLGISEDQLEEILNSEDVLEKIDEILQSTEGFKAEIGNILQKRLSDVVESIEGVNDLDDSLKAFLTTNVQGLKLDGLTEKQIEEYSNRMREITERIINDKQLQRDLINYDKETATQVESEKTLNAYKKAIGGLSEDGTTVTDDVMKQLYTNAGFNFIDRDGDGQYTDLVTKQEYLAYQINQDHSDNNILGYGTDNAIWKNYTESELSTLYEDYDLVVEDEEVQNSTGSDRQKAIKRRIQEINMQTYSVQQLFGVLESDINKLASKQDGLWGGTLADGVEKFNDDLKETSEAYNKLSNLAEMLGVKSVKALAKMSKFLKIDHLGYSTMSMSEIQDSFNQLQSIRDTLAYEGAISAEDWDYLAENFSSVLAQASARDMIKAMDDALEAKEFQIKAEIQGTLAEDSGLYDQFAAGITQGFDSGDKSLNNVLKFYGNMNNFRQIEDIQSSLALAGDNESLKKKQIAKAFGVDTNDADWEEILENYISLNFDGMSYNAFLGQMEAFDSIGVKEAWTKYTSAIADAQMEIQKTQQNNEAFSKELDAINNAYQRGNISQEQYLNNLKRLQGDSRASAEQLKELKEAIEDATFDSISEKFNEGALSIQQFNNELSKLAKNNVVGTEDWEKIVDAAISANDQIISLNDQNISMLDMDSIDDFDTKRGLQQSNIDTAQKKLAEIYAAGKLEHGDSYDPESDPKYMAAKEGLYNEIKEYSEIFNEQKSFLEGQLSDGSINQQKYIDSLDAMIKSNELTAEQVNNFKEAIEDANYSLRQYFLTTGTQFDANGNIVDSDYTGADFRSQTLLDIGGQARGSEDEQKLLETYFKSFDSDIAKNEQKIELVRGGYLTYGDKDKYESEKELNGRNAALAYEKMMSLKAAGYSENSEEFQSAQAEAIKWMEANSAVDMQKAEDLEEDYQNGSIGLETFLSGLEEISKSTDLTAEDFEKLSEQIEDTSFELSKLKFETGRMSGDVYRTDLLGKIKSNEKDSEDEIKFKNAYLDSFDSEISAKQHSIDLAQKGYYDTSLYGDKYEAQKALNKENAALAYEKMESAKILFGEDSEQYRNAESELVKWLEANSAVEMQKVQDLEDDYQNGSIGLEDFLSGLEDISESADLTAEDFEKLSEQIEDTKIKLSQLEFETGKISGDQHRQNLLEQISKNAKGSEDEQNFLKQYFGSFDTEIASNQKQIDLIRGGHLSINGKDKYESEKELNKRNAALAYEKMESLKAAGYSDDSAEVQAARAEAIKWMESNSAVEMQKASDLEEDYQNGSIGLEAFLSGLEDISDSADLTAEDFEKLSEQIEDTRLELAKINFTEGKITGDEYRAELMKKIQNNEEGSEDRRSAIQEYVSSYGTEVSMSETKASLLADNDFAGKAQYIANDITTLTESLAFMEAAGLQNSEEYYQTVSRIVDKKKEQLELQKQLYEYEIQKSGEVLDAYSNILSYGMDELKKRQQDINDMYDDEISKLQDINDQKQRSIELTRLEQELENAKKEKVRVYQAGIGFTYQSNKAKVKEAKQNLDQFNSEQKISDLQHAQEAQNKLIEDQIKRLQDIQDYISGIKQTAEVTASLMDLKKHGIVPQNATISDAINQITAETVNGEGGKISSLGSAFETFAGTYTANSALLASYTDNLETKLSEISDTYMSYENDKAMVSDFTSQLDTKINGEGTSPKQSSDSLSNIDSTLATFIGEQTVEQINNSVGGITSAINNKDIVKPSDISTVQDRLKAFFNEGSTTTIDGISGSLGDIQDAVDNKQIPTSNDTKNNKTVGDILSAFIGEKTVGDINTAVGNVASAIANKTVFKSSDITTLSGNVQTIATKLSNLIGDKNFDNFAKGFADKFTSALTGSKEPVPVDTTPDYSDAFKKANGYLEQVKRALALQSSFKKTTSDGTWIRWFKEYKNQYTGKTVKDKDTKITYYQFYNTESGNYWWTDSAGKKDDTVGKDSQYWSQEQLEAAGITGFSTGIENGPVTYTGLAMLHGSPSNPEYVLNSEQAGTLLKNLATMTVSPYQAPTVDSYNNQQQPVVYQFNGDMNLPNVQKPDQFFDELMKQANVQFPTIKRNYY